MEKRKVPFFNYQALFAQHEQEFIGLITDVCRRGAYILQRDLQEFESSLASFIGAKHVIGVADGTNALSIGLLAMGIGAGDEVIVPSHTYIASASSIHSVGAVPVLADCGADHLIDPSSVETLITRKTKAIMPVHLNGRTCTMDPLLVLAAKYGLQIIEDAAQAVGSRYNGQYAGTFGSIGTYSFYPAKILGCFGDGGAVVTNSDVLAEKVAQLHDHGRNKDGLVVCWGTNSRLDNLQAAILSWKLKSLNQTLERRRAIARRYHDGLSVIDDLTLPPAPREPDEKDGHFDVYQNYELESGRRDSLRAYLQEQGIGTLIQWGGRAVHQFKELGFKGSHLPATERLFQRCFMLPMHNALSDADVDYVIECVQGFYKV